MVRALPTPREVRAKALGREPSPSLLLETEPHERAFGTAARFMPSTATITPGPFTSAQELQLVTGFTPLVVYALARARTLWLSLTLR